MAMLLTLSAAATPKPGEQPRRCGFGNCSRDKMFITTMVRPALCLLALGFWSLRAFAVEVPPGFIAETLATNLNAALAIAPTPDGRIFLTDQTGKLLLWKNGALLAEPALTLHVTDYWERGLIGLSLHPDFPRIPHLFALYVT